MRHRRPGGNATRTLLARVPDAWKVLNGKATLARPFTVTEAQEALAAAQWTAYAHDPAAIAQAVRRDLRGRRAVNRPR